MELVTTFMVVGLVAALVRGLQLPTRFREARFNAELASIVDSGTAELVEEQLRVEPQLVRVRTGRHMSGPFLDILLGSRRLHLRLYQDARTPVPSGQAFARLTHLRRVDEIGWVAEFDGPRGPQQYLGWLVETAAA
jgi:hypothetical protein